MKMPPPAQLRLAFGSNSSEHVGAVGPELKQLPTMVRQVPFEQACPGAQGGGQAVDVGGGGGGGTHTPPPQDCPLGHTFLHWPQFAGSLAVSTQTPSHAICPLGQQSPVGHSW